MCRFILMFFALISVRSSLVTVDVKSTSDYELQSVLNNTCLPMCSKLCPSLKKYPTVSPDVSICEMICPELCLEAFESVPGNEKKEKCYDFEGFGCVPYISGDPDARKDVNITFVLYNKNTNGQTLDQYNPNGVLQSSLDSEIPTKFIIHGFWDEIPKSYATDWIKTMKDKLLEEGNYNVIYVGWDSSFKLIPYYQPVANTIVVGLEIANMIKHLKNKMGLNPEDVHLIGHSLGAHAAGYAGKYTPGLDRITGLDPAKPLFHDRPIEHRLYHTDAYFVDVIHTNTYLLGIEQPCGHLDFYPNGGSQQPNCIFSSCSHSRAYELFTESIYSQCVFKGCGKINDNTVCAVMGLNAKKPTSISNYDIRYYLNTTGTSPYCPE